MNGAPRTGGGLRYLHLRPYYGDEDDTDGLYHSVAKRGTTAFHALALRACEEQTRYRWRYAVSKTAIPQVVSLTLSSSSVSTIAGRRGRVHAA